MCALIKKNSLNNFKEKPMAMTERNLGTNIKIYFMLIVESDV